MAVGCRLQLGFLLITTPPADRFGQASFCCLPVPLAGRLVHTGADLGDDIIGDFGERQSLLHPQVLKRRKYSVALVAARQLVWRLVT
tara:strand:- start:28 stop:288 length:261 start_codon:yes stop_codon:yes gene_type:complete